MTIPERLKAWRLKKRGGRNAPLSQKEAAVLVGASAPAWSDWENGHKIPDLECAVQIEREVGILVSEWAELVKERRETRKAAKDRDARTSRKAG